MTPDRVRGRVEKIQAAGDSSPVIARDPVNLPMIHNWVEAIGDCNPVYVDLAAAHAAGHRDLVAPPAMLQVWTMGGLQGAHPAGDPLSQAVAVLNEAGYTAVVATNCQQTYPRYLHHGERLSMVTSLVDVVGPKRTALGEGWFMTTRHTWYSGAEPVGEMLLRMLKYAPPLPDRQARADVNAGATADSEDRAPADPLTDGSGRQLPVMTIAATPTFIIATALATRDFQDVHHDRDKAIAYGTKDIFVNILTDTGLAQRFVTDWAGPSARVRGISLQLLVPCYAYDTLVFNGKAIAVAQDEEAVSVVGRVQPGDHVVGTVRITNR